MGKTLIKLLPHHKVKYRWISNHYDIHLNGTCIYENQLCEFKNFYPDYDDDIEEYEEMYTEIYRLSFLSKIRWYWRQWLFETCVGYHWTYPQRTENKSFKYRNPKWLYVRLYKFYYRNK